MGRLACLGLVGLAVFALMGWIGPRAVGTAAATYRAGPAPVRVPTVSRPCGTAKGAPRVHQVLLIWEENHSFASVIGNPSAPEINQLARACGLVTNYRALTHPSLPNYLEMTSGRKYAGSPWDSDCDAVSTCTTPAVSIFSELGTTGHQWRSYAEAMRGNCSPVSYGDYAARHNPAVYYTNIRGRCRSWDQPMGGPADGPLHEALAAGPTVALSTMTPDVEDDMHSGTVAQADHWLAGWLPRIVSSSAYRSGSMAVLVAWDEGSGGGNVRSHAPLIVMSAFTPPGTRSALGFDDYSILRTIADITGVRPPAGAARATSLSPSFHL